MVCEDNKIKEAKDAGADIVGGDDFIDKIKNGEINFEKLICTPSMMIKVIKIRKSSWSKRFNAKSKTWFSN